MKPLKLTLLFITTLCLSSCSWGILLAVGNSSDHDIVVTYEVNETEFSKKPSTYSFNKKIKYLYKNNPEKRPIKLPNNAVYDATSNTVTLTIKPNEAAIIGGYASFESLEEKIIKSKLNVQTAKKVTINSEQLIQTRTKLTRKVTILEIN